MKNPSLKAIAAGALLAICALVAAGCNTIEGIGEDLSAGGEGISNAASGANPSDDK